MASGCGRAWRAGRDVAIGRRREPLSRPALRCCPAPNYQPDYHHRKRATRTSICPHYRRRGRPVETVTCSVPPPTTAAGRMVI